MSRRSIIAGILVLPIIFAASPSRAAVINSVGIWADPTGEILTLLPVIPDIVNGVGTDTLNWGIRTAEGGDQQSSWVFDGIAGTTLPTDPDGVVFELGTFTHNNIPILQGEPDFPADDFTGANLLLDIQLLNGNIFNQNFNVTLSHFESPNALPCCPDEVGLPDISGGGGVTIDGVDYMFDIFGFRNLPAGPPITQLITAEGSSNSTKIFGSLTRIPTGVPEPTTTTLLGGAVVGLFAMARRRRHSGGSRRG